jgi:hypothetical protein
MYMYVSNLNLSYICNLKDKTFIAPFIHVSWHVYDDTNSRTYVMQ